MKQNTASQRIVTELRARMRSGALAPGDRVPSAREIVREWNVALATATKVHAILRREGLVRAKPGIGTIVRGERGADLSRERIVQTALSIADDEGIGALTMRLLAKELGVATMSLYRHVASREELVTAMVDAALAEEPPPTRGKQKPRAHLEELARRSWVVYQRHTWLAHALSMTRPQVIPNGMRYTDSVLEAIVALGVPDAEALPLGVAFLGLIRGLAGALEAERFAEQDTGQSPEEWMAEHEPEFERHVARYPSLARLSGLEDVPLGVDALFALTVRTFLDGLGRRRA